MFLFCVIVGIVVGFVIIFSSTNYITLLTSESKMIYPFINGTAETAVYFWKRLLLFLTPMLLMFLLGLNYYLSLLNYVFITYQSSLLILSCGAILKTYGVSGVLNIIFIILPVNVLYFAVLVFFASLIIKRSKGALKNKQFSYGFDEIFFAKVGVSVIAIILLSILVAIVYPLFLKNSVFVIF